MKRYLFCKQINTYRRDLRAQYHAGGPHRNSAMQAAQTLDVDVQQQQAGPALQPLSLGGG
jgi:hypothetical protein